MEHTILIIANRKDAWLEKSIGELGQVVEREKAPQISKEDFMTQSNEPRNRSERRKDMHGKRPIDQATASAIVRGRTIVPEAREEALKKIKKARKAS